MITKKIEAVKALKDSQDPAAIKKAADDLSTELQKIGKSMQDKGSQSGPAGAPGTQEPKS